MHSRNGWAGSRTYFGIENLRKIGLGFLALLRRRWGYHPRYGPYLVFANLSFAISPHKSRRPLLLKSREWEWICDQIFVDALRPQWLRRPLVDQVGILFANLFRKSGGCRLPLRVGPTVAPQ